MWNVFPLYKIILCKFYIGTSASYDTDDSRYDRNDRSRRRMTDDDDTVLDNASVNSQDQGQLLKSV